MALILMTIALAGCAGTEELQDFGTVEAPAIKAGYAYAYDGLGSFHITARTMMDGETMGDVDESEDLPRAPLFAIQILNTSFGPNGSHYIGAAHIAQARNASSFTSTPEAAFGKAPVAIRKADLAAFDVTTRQAQRCDPGCRLTTTDIAVGDSTPLDPYIDFPLFAGKAWANHMELGIPDSEATMLVKSRVLGKETVDVMNITMDAIHIEHRFSLPPGDALGQAIRGQMEAEGAEDVTVRIVLDGIGHTYYAEDVMNVVRDSASIDMTVDVQFTIEGSAMENHMRLAMDFTKELSGMTLEEDAELDAAGIAAFLDGAKPIKQAGPIPTGAYDISISADKAEFNVAKDNTVAFAVGADPTIPAQDFVRYTISNAQGVLVDDGIGQTFSTTFTEPGLYKVVAQAMSPAGVVQAMDSMMIAADYEATVELTCGNVVLSALPDSNTCTSAAIPLSSAVGLQDVTITINAANPAALGGTLRITDDVGTSVERSAADGEGFTLADLGSLTIGADGWVATWHRDAALLEDASITMVFDYGPEAAASEAADGGLMLRLMQDQVRQAATGWTTIL